MLTLEKPSDEAFERFKALATSIYIDELLKYQEYGTREAATRYATGEIAALIPQGVNTPGHHIYFLKDSAQETVGYLWYQIEPTGYFDKPQSFLAYLYIHEAYRRKGYASQALHAWETKLSREHGIDFAYFYVFKDNTPAIALYHAHGYQTDEELGWPEFSTKKRFFMAKKL